jgi:phosphoribosylaminoimidazolecarboxamide formyltransferase/IMP cyclohydrolase
MTRTILLSVYDKTNLTEYARQLIERDWQLLASGGTAKVIDMAGLPVKDIADIVGEPILGHRVVTLSREVHAGLLAKDTAEDRAELASLGVDWIDAVCVDLYPLLDAIQKPGATKQSVIEMTDIGGPAMLTSGASREDEYLLSAAAKGRRFVLCKTAELQQFIAWLDAGEPNPDLVRNEMAVKADSTVSIYRLTSALYHTQDSEQFRRWQAVYHNFTGEPFPLLFNQRA